jgi:hypothetical protein
MKKTSPKKLTLSRETLSQLDERETAQAAGGYSRPEQQTCQNCPSNNIECTFGTRFCNA